MVRRTLDLPDLNAVVADAESLQRSGYTKGGQWDLAQVCTHITIPLHGSITEIPLNFKVPWHLKLIVKLLGVKKQVLRTRQMREGFQAPAEMIPAPGIDEGQAIAELRRAVERYQAYQGPMQTHPIFGALTREEWTQLITIHSMHHLSFLIPAAR